MKVVVTGASGNIGTALLRERSWEIVGVSRRRPDTGLPWVQCDLGDSQAVGILTDALRGADVVVHLAWAIHPRTDDPDMYRTNVAGTDNLLRAVAAAGVPHLVCASSVAAYAPGGSFVDESWPCTGVPGSAYSATKALMESQLDAFSLRNPSTGIARIRPCGVVQGAAAAEFRSWLLSPLIPAGILGRRWLPIPLWPGMRLQITHSDDVAQAIRLIIAQRATGPFNLAGEPLLPAGELAGLFGGPRVPVPLSLLMAAAWLGWRVGVQPLHPGWLRLADRASTVDSSRARRELGWSPEHDAGAAVRELVASMRSLGPGEKLRFGRPSHQSQSPTRFANGQIPQAAK